LPVITLVHLQGSDGKLSGRTQPTGAKALESVHFGGKRTPSNGVLPNRRSSRNLAIAAFVLALACFCAGAWIERESLLQGMAELWITSDTVTDADAVVVLGGGLDVRPFAAADLYRRGRVNKVLISQVGDDPAASIGAILNHTEANRQVLLKLGVPADAIETFGTANGNTSEEAFALSAWAERNNASTFIIPTEIFSSRRVQFIFRRELPAKSIEVLSLEPPWYKKDDWWKTDTGIIAFQNEIMKYIYYRVKY
jgi:uncharacterized SAM-binding protein YcdF (DUF218 family)